MGVQQRGSAHHRIMQPAWTRFVGYVMHFAYWQDPVSAECGHAFCRGCIGEFTAAAVGACKCPSCSAPLTINFAATATVRRVPVGCVACSAKALQLQPRLQEARLCPDFPYSLDHAVPCPYQPSHAPQSTACCAGGTCAAGPGIQEGQHPEPH